MDSMSLQIFDEPEEAQTYSLPEFEEIFLKNAAVVMNGTVNGNAAVDLVFEDYSGQKHVAMVKASYLRMIISAIMAEKPIAVSGPYLSSEPKRA